MLRFLLLLTIIAYCLFAVSEAKSVTSWSFPNWNSFNSLQIGQGSKMDSDWKIPFKDGWNWIWEGSRNSVIVTDPSSKKSKDKVFRVTYPKGSMNPQSSPKGGVGFRASPISVTKSSKTVSFTYSVYFPKGFNFVKGGKLPGLYGGVSTGCSGGDHANDCFTTRLMWRKKGEGEIYAYLPKNQHKGLCTTRNNVCDNTYGISLGRGNFSFATGQWNSVTQNLTINTPNKQDGTVILELNGKTVLRASNMLFRITPNVFISGIMFDTFFGGSSHDFITPTTQYSYFKDFSMSVK